VTDKIIHVDFSRISTDRKIDIKVPIKFIGEPYGVKTQGGIAEYDMRELTVRCFPSDIPDEINIDVSSLKIGDSIRVKDLKFDKFEIRENPENLIISIISTSEEAESVPQAQPSQPEVIEKGKKAEAEEGAKKEEKKEEKKK
jgi:large subunit ribosomal protein L25